MKNRKKVIRALLVFVFIIGVLVFVFTDNKSKNNKLMPLKESLIDKQIKLEKDFKIAGYTIDNPNVILDPYKNSPLTALIIFETKEKVSPVVLVKGKDEYSTFEHKFASSKKHYLEIYGLYPDKENEIVIEYQLKNKKISKTIKIKTDKLPDNFIIPTSVNAKREKLNNDLYFFSPSGLNRACAYDINGDVRWYLSTTALWDNTRLKNGHMLVGTERLVNMPYYVTGLYEIDLLGKIYNEYSLPGGYHHDYFELPNGNLLVASNDFYNDCGTVEDYIVEIDRKTGKIIKSYDLKDILDMDDGKSADWSVYDWFHNNSIWYDEKTDSITLSGRHKDAIINISHKTGKLNWIIGDKTNWNKEYHKYFFEPIKDTKFEWQWSQHAAMITPEGYVFVLDNGNNKSKIKEEYVSANNSYTRGVMYKIDTNKMTIEQIWQYGKERGSEFYSPYISDVDYLAKDHYIIHSGGIVYDKNGQISNQPAGFVENPTLVSDTVEILNDEVIFEIKLPTNNYRVEKMSLYNETELELRTPKTLGTLGKTKITKKEVGMISGKPIDRVYEQYKIKFENEKDRLSLTGQFKKEDDVNIILYKNLISKYYKVDVSKKPYTALCVDAFTELEKENGIMINKYINKDGLNGKYSIYLEINGTIYNTGEYVKF